MAQSIPKEARINLAIQSYRKGQFSSTRAAADAYSVCYNTVNRRMNGTRTRRDAGLDQEKLTQQETEVIIQRVLDMDTRGFSPRMQDLADMANLLLTERGGEPVGKNWPSKFINRHPELKTRIRRPYDYQRAKCEDPEIIQGWFNLVHNTINKYGIQIDDIYNFDEVGFMMGIITAVLVITASERRARPKAIQPGDREWVTTIEAVNATGWAIPPFIILKGKEHLSTWYQEDLPKDWVLAVSENGWTTDELGFK